MHEMAHALGFTSCGLEGEEFVRGHVVGQALRRLSVSCRDTDVNFVGPQATVAFDNAGGLHYPENKVPVENNTDGVGRETGLGHGIFSLEDGQCSRHGTFCPSVSLQFEVAR